jgi:nucleotide-binding universal stress UspA family protein
MYDHILVGYDDSEDSKKALEKAAQFFLIKKNCKITIVHVDQETISETAMNNLSMVKAYYPAMPKVDGSAYPIQLPINEEDINPNKHQVINNSVNQAISNAKAFLNHKGVQAEYEILDGNPANGICDFALRHKVDLIIVGNSGKGKLKRLFIGSVSEGIMKNSEKDVLVVK